MSEHIDEPTKGEIVRRLDSIADQLTDLTSRLERDRLEAAQTYVRQDVYAVEQRLQDALAAELQTDVAALRRERDEDRNWRRQVVLWLGSLTVTLLLGFATLIVSVLG